MGITLEPPLGMCYSLRDSELRVYLAKGCVELQRMYKKKELLGGSTIRKLFCSMVTDNK